MRFLLILIAALTLPISSFSANRVEFLKKPAEYMVDIYRDYHRYKVDRGIEKAKKALKLLDPIYRKNPNYEFRDKELKKRKAYQVKSMLHTLLAILYYRKAMLVRDTDTERRFAELAKSVDPDGKRFLEFNQLITLYMASKELGEKDKNLEKRIKELEKELGVKESQLEEIYRLSVENAKKVDAERDKYVKLCLSEFRKAFKVDPNNADAHVQLARIYGEIGMATGDTEAAEREYYLAGKIFKKEGDVQDLREVIKRIKRLNPKSKYIKLLETSTVSKR